MIRDESIPRGRRRIGASRSYAPRSQSRHSGIADGKHQRQTKGGTTRLDLCSRLTATLNLSAEEDQLPRHSKITSRWVR